MNLEDIKDGLRKRDFSCTVTGNQILIQTPDPKCSLTAHLKAGDILLERRHPKEAVWSGLYSNDAFGLDCLAEDLEKTHGVPNNL